MNKAPRGVTTAIKQYISRADFLDESCHGLNVLHLGCSSGAFIKARIGRNSLLHTKLHSTCKTLYGIDLDADSLEVMRSELGYDNLYTGDVQNLDAVPIDRQFDIVLAGDLLEHITCPGAMLEGINRFLKQDGKIIISTINAFGLHAQIRRWLGRYIEHYEHVCFYSPETLINLFQRHGYKVTELYGAYTEPPYTIGQRIKFAIGAPLFRLFPVLAGTLVVVASLEDAGS